MRSALERELKLLGWECFVLAMEGVPLGEWPLLTPLHNLTATSTLSHEQVPAPSLDDYFSVSHGKVFASQPARGRRQWAWKTAVSTPTRPLTSSVGLISTFPSELRVEMLMSPVLLGGLGEGVCGCPGPIFSPWADLPGPFPGSLGPAVTLYTAFEMILCRECQKAVVSSMKGQHGGFYILGFQSRFLRHQ